MAAFHLLGAIFILDNTADNIGNRITLSLGVFALIFTLPQIVDQMKSVTNGPTVDDSLLSIIIVSSVEFAISSVISSNPCL
jgi:hypothetical protein